MHVKVMERGNDMHTHYSISYFSTDRQTETHIILTLLCFKCKCLSPVSLCAYIGNSSQFT